MQWISIKDRLPPFAGYAECKQFLIYEKFIRIAYWYNNKWVDDPEGFYVEFDVTHWMPLPKPPKLMISKDQEDWGNPITP